MNEQFGDARLEELELLSEIGRQQVVTVQPTMAEPRRDMIAFLVAEGFVTDAWQVALAGLRFFAARWPTKRSGPVVEDPRTTWLGVDTALRRGLASDTTLRCLLHRHSRHAPPVDAGEER